MRVEKQGKSECALATIAALADVPLAKVRTAARERTGCAWSKIETKVFWATIKLLLRQFGLPERLAATWYKQQSKKVPTRPHLAGKGTLIIHTLHFSVTHIMPYENHLLYDPEYPARPFRLNDLPKEWIPIGTTKIIDS